MNSPHWRYILIRNVVANVAKLVQLVVKRSIASAFWFVDGISMLCSRSTQSIAAERRRQPQMIIIMTRLMTWEINITTTIQIYPLQLLLLCVIGILSLNISLYDVCSNDVVVVLSSLLSNLKREIRFERGVVLSLIRSICWQMNLLLSYN